jgi:hypothetical protein
VISDVSATGYLGQVKKGKYVSVVQTNLHLLLQEHTLCPSSIVGSNVIQVVSLRYDGGELSS